VTRAISLLFHDVYASDPAESGFVSDAANRYKLPVSAFEAHLDGVARARNDRPVVVGRAVQRGTEDLTQSSLRSGDRQVSALSPPLRSLRSNSDRLPWLITFDDGGVSYYTAIAERLETRGWRGHCFVTTNQIGRQGFLDTAQLRALDARGHVIGSHSASHPTRFSACSYSQMVDEWRQSRAVLEDILGHAVTVASIPGGYFSPEVARSAQEAGITVLFTSEPLTAIDADPITLVGRFTIRLGDRPDASMRLVSPAPWARADAWLRWNAKGLVKPLLGPAYMRVADRVHAFRGEPRPIASTDLPGGRSS
jgi:peptidoglycan/xylan/chitin deacetylase (PgdA/CDA1 family)